MYLFSACTPPLCVGGGCCFVSSQTPTHSAKRRDLHRALQHGRAEPSVPGVQHRNVGLPPGRVGPFERSVTGWRSLAIQLALFPSPFGTAYFSARKSDVIIIVILLASAEPLFLTEFFFVEAL